MKWAFAVVLALSLSSQPVHAKKREYQWKTGSLTVLGSEAEVKTAMNEASNLDPTAMQVVEQTWTYQVEGAEGTYVVTIKPQPLTKLTGIKVSYDIDGKTMLVSTGGADKKPKVTNLQIVRFTPKK